MLENNLDLLLCGYKRVVSDSPDDTNARQRLTRGLNRSADIKESNPGWGGQFLVVTGHFCLFLP